MSKEPKVAKLMRYYILDVSLRDCVPEVGSCENLTKSDMGYNIKHLFENMSKSYSIKIDDVPE